MVTLLAGDSGCPDTRTFSTAPAADLYLPVDPDADAPTVSDQENDKDSLLHLTRSLIALRKTHPALGGDAAFRPILAEKHQRSFVNARSDDSDRFAIAFNPDGTACHVETPEFEGATVVLAEGAALNGCKLSLDGFSFAILKLKHMRCADCHVQRVNPIGG